jgi:hypothetical protein
MMTHSNSVKKGKLKRRLLFKPLTCSADGCRNRFTPIREGHVYCSNTCSAYMRNRAKRERDKKKEKVELAGINQELNSLPWEGSK